MLPVRKRTRCAVENTNENSENVVNIGKAALPIKKEHKVSFNPSDVKEPKPAAGLPSRRSRGDAHPSEAAAPAGQHWRDRTSRTRRHVATTEENIPVLRHAMEAEPLPHPRHAERVAASLPPTAPGLESILHKAVQNVTTRRRAQALREDARTTDLDQLWRAAITTKAAGHHPPLWTVRDKGRMRHNIRKIDLPDPAMRWGAIIEWVARHWGEATSLAIPFMLRDADKREGILQAMPSLSLFLHFTDHYVQAYATKWHGRGHRAEDEERARQDAAMHDRWMNRAAAVHQRGYDNLPREHMENDELEDVVTRLAQNDAEAQAVLDGREEHRALVRQFRRRYGANYRAVLQTHIARERRRLDMEADGGPDLSDLYPTHDYSDE